MNAWILIISWAVGAPYSNEAHSNGQIRTHAIAMQEFGDVSACQFASVEAQKIAPGIRAVCVQKGH